jgi:hypothetical protein
MKKNFIVEYYLEATVSFSAEIEADSEEEAKQITRDNMGSEEHEERDWDTHDYVFVSIEEYEE